jgi:hypothetical protein
MTCPQVLKTEAGIATIDYLNPSVKIQSSREGIPFSGLHQVNMIAVT